ncbi:hypothetical protein EDB19DRAFT_1973362 [Suillus lakei]|nr:hypothetical protein EDB19DRAFT_1973362 [Suillus lakei]
MGGGSSHFKLGCLEVGGWDWDRQKQRQILCSVTIHEDVQTLAGTTLIRLLVIKGLVILPLEMRLVAPICSLLAQNQGQTGPKIIVFLSCPDSVDVRCLLGDSSMDGDKAEKTERRLDVPSSCSLPTSICLASLCGFFAVPSSNNKLAPSFSTLLFTNVAPCDLDLPLVRAVIQYDLPTQGGATEYVHIVGRTIRAGNSGGAWSIVGTSESEWMEGKMRGDITGDHRDGDKVNITLEAASIESVWFWWKRLRSAELARGAFAFHTRAYATYPSNEKHIFRHLHIGHLAKAFGLRKAPKTITDGKNKVFSASKGRDSRPVKSTKEHGVGDAEQRMQNIVRAQGRLSKKGGKMISGGTNEFQRIHSSMAIDYITWMAFPFHCFYTVLATWCILRGMKYHTYDGQIVSAC